MVYKHIVFQFVQHSKFFSSIGKLIAMEVSDEHLAVML